MGIIVAVTKGAPTKTKGDLLERIVGELLMSQNYEVVTQIRNVGSEIDLLCIHKANKAKKVYVECKAYDQANKIQADVIKNLVGTRNIHGYDEAWLATTSDLGRDAKGLQLELESRENAKQFTFYTPEKLISVFEDNRTICRQGEAKTLLEHYNGPKDSIGKLELMICDLGFIWVAERITNSRVTGLFFVDAEAKQIITDPELLYYISELDSPFTEQGIFTLSQTDGSLRAVILPPHIQSIGLCDEYLKQINELTVKFEHPERQELNLEDVFVFQDVEQMGIDEPEKSSSSILMNDLNKVLILGEDLSGKTSLAHMMQIHLVRKGRIAVYIPAVDIKNANLASISTVIISKYRQQYSNNEIHIEKIKDILQNNRELISIIIDEFEKVGIRHEDSVPSFINMLEKEFTDIKIFAHKNIELRLLAKANFKGALTQFSQYRLLQMGHVRRDEVIEKWITLGNQEDYIEADVIARKREVAKKINTAIGANYLPTYPFYLLTMLHLFEVGSKTALKGSYAELYNFLINQALLSTGADPADLDFYHTYLSHLAYKLFTGNNTEISKGDLEAEFVAYCTRMDIVKTFGEVHNTLIRARLVKYQMEEYSFYLNYCRYYFVAKYLADNIDKEIPRNQIIELVQDLGESDHANIVIFLVHHSKSPVIVQAVMGESRKLFSDMNKYGLTIENASSINGLLESEIKRTFQDKDPREIRKRQLEKRDSTKQDTDQEYENNQDDIFAQIHLSFKIIEVLGQIANNYYGSLEGENKAAIISELSSLGLRSLNAFLAQVSQYIDSIKQDIGAELELRPQKGSTPASRDMMVNTAVYQFTQWIILVFLGRISRSVSSKNLFPTIDRVLGENVEPSARILELMVHLDFPGQLSENNAKIAQLYSDSEANFIVKDLVRVEVMRHMYKFDLDVREKQRICEKLGIDYVKASKAIARHASA